jgi:hypothetical protein
MNLMERFRRQFAFNWGVGTIEFGAGKVAQLGPIAKAMKARNLLVVTDKAIAKTDIPGKVEDSLKGAKVSYTIFGEVEPNPLDTIVEKARPSPGKPGPGPSSAWAGAAPSTRPRASPSSPPTREASGTSRSPPRRTF